jgi:hypothetical protein
MAPKDVILAAGLIGLNENRPNDKSRHYLLDNPWRHISLFSGLGVKEGKIVLSPTNLKNRWENRVIMKVLLETLLTMRQ